MSLHNASGSGSWPQANLGQGACQKQPGALLASSAPDEQCHCAAPPQAQSAFNQLLSAAATFYRSLALDVQAVYGHGGCPVSFPEHPAIGAGATPPTPNASPIDARPTISRCLICLGDLARYAPEHACIARSLAWPVLSAHHQQGSPHALHLSIGLACKHPLRGAALQSLASACHRYQINASQEAATRDWAPAARHYLQAARVLPTTGNAYNQLAVLDTCALLCCMHVHLQMHYVQSVS